MTESNELSFQDALENVEFSLDDTDDEVILFLFFLFVFII